MKKMMIKVRANEKKETKKMPEMNFASEWFKCRNCGYTVRIKSLRDTARCSQCGGTMDRC